MPIDIVMPRLSDTMEEGRILKWLKREGDTVKKGEAIAEVETDKANMELEAFDSGVMDRILLGEGESAPVGQVIAYLKPLAAVAAARPAAEEKAPERMEAKAETKREAAPPPLPPAPHAEAAQPPTAKPGEEEKIKASPLARRIAEERGVDLAKVEGTGPEGRVTREDVLGYLREMEETRAVPERVAPARPAAPAPQPEITPAGPAKITGARAVDLTRMQATIAKRMVHSKTTVPHYYVTTEVDMAEAKRFVENAKAALGQETEITYTHLIVKASAMALAKFPQVNASYVEGKIEFHDRVNVGIAVALPDGLLVPVIHDCQGKGLKQIASEARELATQVRSGQLAAQDFEGGTFTVSNLGMFDVDHFAAIINTPESAILCVGSMRPKPSIVDGQIAVRQKMKLSLSCDHRVYYGATAAQFLQELKRLMENPLNLVL